MNNAHNIFPRQNRLLAISCLVLVMAGTGGCASFGGKSASDDSADGDEAVVDVSKIAEDDTEGQFEAAVKLMQKRRYRQAEPLLEKLAESQPKNAAVKANLGILYARTKRPAEAEAILLEARRRDSKLPEVHNQLGILQAERQSLADAERSYLKAIDLNPNYAEAHYNLALLYDSALPRPASALSHYRKYEALSGDLDRAQQAKLAIWQRRLQDKIDASAATAAESE